MGHRKKTPETPGFKFIFVDGALPRTTAQRRRIRQHTMRKVAASRKELGTYSKCNVGQYPVFMDGGQRTEEPAGQVPRVAVGQSKIVCVIPRSVPAQGYERARITFDFDLLSLSALTSFHFTRVSAKALTTSRERLRGVLMSSRDASYLDYVPQLYSQSRLIRRVVDCTLARAKRTVTGDSNVAESEILLLYGSALLELQSALQDPKRRFDAEVLCATHLLAMYEVGVPTNSDEGFTKFGQLLDLTSTTRWERHVSGMIKLMEMRGAHRYATDFERCLFTSALGTIVRCTAWNFWIGPANVPSSSATRQ
jgi:hypothetical protein